MDYPIQSTLQLSSHLRALRKARGLSQAQLGGLLGVGQARIARIERDPSAVSVEQFMALLGALGVQLVLHADGVGDRPALRSAGSRSHAAAGRAGPGTPADDDDDAAW